MNSVVLIGRLANDPELSYTTSQNAVCKFTLAVEKKKRLGEDSKADFLRIVVWGSQGENASRYLKKGSRAGIHGRIETGSYKNRDGQTVNTVDIVADYVEFLNDKPKTEERNAFAEVNEFPLF